MSGGSYNYAYRQIEDLAESISERAGCCELEGPGTYGSPPSLRRAFCEHLKRVAAACHAIEWNDSCDGHADEQRLIRECIAPGAELEHSIQRAGEAAEELANLLERARALASAPPAPEPK